MEEYQKENLFLNLKTTLNSIVEDKRKNPKNTKAMDEFKARINIGYQVGQDEYFWCNMIAENGNYTFSRGKLDEYDLALKATPEDSMAMHSGQASSLHMLTRKNEFGYRKLRTEKGSDGKRHLGILLKLSKVLVLD
ncbi:MAG: hypothetical protein ACFFC1_13525 [Promethearchaeota archaeon]